MTNEELVQAYQDGDKQALDELIEQNSGIIYTLANKFYIEKTSSIDIEDLEQEGYIGLIIAAQRYDLNNPKKAKFITYAVHWIYQKMHRFITYRNTNNEISLNTPIKSIADKPVELMDTITDDNCYENIEDKLFHEQLRKELEEVMNEYNTLKEKEILKLRYGWDAECMTFQAIGNLLEIPKEAVRYNEERALRKLRHSTWARKMAKEYYQEKFSNINIPERIINADDFKQKYVMSQYVGHVNTMKYKSTY